MTEEERTAYIKTLKVGDSACYTMPRAFGNRSDTRVVLVVKITPKGIIRVSDGQLFNSQGRSSIKNGWVYLEPHTPEIAERMERSRIVDVANHSAYILGSRYIDLSKVSSRLLQELISLEARISLSLKEPAKETEPPRKLYRCGCGRESTKTYTDPQFGGSSDVCDDCYDIEECQDQGHGVTGESYSREECIEILESRGWKSHY